MAHEESVRQSEADVNRNYRDAIGRFVVGYNKSVVLTPVTERSLEVLDESMARIDSELSSIVAAFEEIRATSGSTANNSERIDTMMREILSKNTHMDAEITARVQEIVQVSEDAGGIADLFGRIKTKTEAMIGVTEAIQDVSDRTNILAINASIEAARAGAVGKGFRIIANEVRTLAKQTEDFTKEIDTNIGEFQRSMDALSSRLEEFLALLKRFQSSFSDVLATFQENSAAVNQAGEFLSEISGSLKEESTALSEGLDSLESISRSAQDTHAVFGALRKSYGYLDTLLSKSEK